MHNADSTARATTYAAPRRRATVTKLPLKRTRTRAKVKTKTKVSAGVMIAAFTFVFFVGAWSFNLFTRSQIADMKKEIIACEETLKSLESESVSIEMQLENKISFQNVEEKAIALGMVKSSDSQHTYINTVTEDRAQIIDDEN